MKVGPNAPCPCGSGQKLKRCCRSLHRGAPAKTPEALMRSRYSAYARGEVEYLIETTDPSGPQSRPDRQAWARELREYCATTEFLGLDMVEAGAAGDEGWVTFHARLNRAGSDVSFSERSRFRRVDGRWLYHSGRAPAET